VWLGFKIHSWDHYICLIIWLMGVFYGIYDIHHQLSASGLAFTDTAELTFANGRRGRSPQQHEALLVSVGVQERHSCGFQGCNQPGVIVCPQCRSTYFCSKEHQRDAWPQHMVPCKQMFRVR
jgi:hypothetical protein